MGIDFEQPNFGQPQSSIETCGDTVFLVFGESDLVPNKEVVFAKLRQFVQSHNLANKRAIDGDCATVAGQVVKELGSFFNQHGYHLDLITTQSRNGEPLPFYKIHGFGHHAMNIAEDEDVAFAFDVTAAYTFSEDHKPIDVLLVAGKTVSEVCERLHQVTQSKWNTRD